ncbi:MAG: NADH-quinone oxidoreductase subunit NuoN [Nocardioidaceae bacterium]|nr:NADH-quinone oxidoreductase subunit NuoN [Nocardioidaceae bacterium]
MIHPLLVSASAPPPIDSPTIQYGDLSPLLVVAAVALLGVMVEAFAPRALRFTIQTALAIGGIVVALAATVWVGLGLDRASGDVLARGRVVAEGAVAVDGPSVFMWGLVLLFALVSMLLFAERRLEGGLSAFTGQAAAPPGSAMEREAVEHRIEHTEVFPLAMFALVGMMLFPAANDLLTMFVALEVLSLPLYLLCGLARRRRLLSQESAMKYFLLGAFSSAFFAYGIALVYGFAGGFGLGDIDQAVSNRIDGQNLLLAGIALMAVGVMFKVGAVPFHAWTPDVYQGAPTAVTAFMAAGTKVAAFGAMLRLFFVAFGGASWDWRPMFWVVAILTMVVGAVAAVTQSDVKRMLAYSSIAHAGFILVGVTGAFVGTRDASVTSVSSVLFYLTVYGFSTIGAFAIVTIVRDASGETTQLSRWAGLGRESPLVAGAFALFMLAFAGIPLTSGFIGKWAVFSAAWSGGAWPLVVVAVLASVVAASFYVRVIVTMFFTEPTGEGPSVAVPSMATTAVIVVAVVVTVLLGVVPGPVLDLAQSAGAFVR